MSTFYNPKLQQKLLFLQQQNRKRVQLAIWRCLFVSGLVISAIATMSSPYWQLTSSSQVILESDLKLGKSTIYSLLQLNYPQLLWSIESNKLSNKLKSIPPIIDAAVTKQMFPPQIKVTIKERVPVATAISQGKIGFLDIDGVWLDANFYGQSEGSQNFTFPQLKVINFQAKYSSIWAEIYRLSTKYPKIKLTELRWDELEHLYLKTNIGKVYLGSDSSLLEEQFQMLARFPKLSNQKNLSGIDYLDLSNPNIPFVQQYTEVK